MNDREHILGHLYQVSFDLGLCGCGYPQAAWETICSILQICRDLESLNEFYDANPGMAHIVLSALEQADLIEHGTIITRCWLTRKGKWTLWAIDQVGLEDLDDKMDEHGIPHYPEECTDACWEIPEEVAPRG